MKSQLNEDVYQYDAHVECIQLLRQLGIWREYAGQEKKYFPSVNSCDITNVATIIYRALIVMVAR